MNKILHRLTMAALGTAAIFSINTLNSLNEASAAANLDGTEINQPKILPAIVPAHFRK